MHQGDAGPITEDTRALSSLKFTQQTPEGGHSGISFPFSEYLLNADFAGKDVVCAFVTKVKLLTS